jgi:hypothetical protein
MYIKQNKPDALRPWSWATRRKRPLMGRPVAKAVILRRFHSAAAELRSRRPTPPKFHLNFIPSEWRRMAPILHLSARAQT